MLLGWKSWMPCWHWHYVYRTHCEGEMPRQTWVHNHCFQQSAEGRFRMWREETKDILQVNSNVVFWYLDIVILNIFLIYFIPVVVWKSQKVLLQWEIPQMLTRKIVKHLIMLVTEKIGNMETLLLLVPWDPWSLIYRSNPRNKVICRKTVQWINACGTMF